MKKLLLLTTITALALASCNSDEPKKSSGEEKPEKKIIGITKNYSFTVSNDLLSTSDVTIKYIDGDNKVISEKISSTSWSKSVDVLLSSTTSDVYIGLFADCDYKTATSGKNYSLGYIEDIHYTVSYNDGSTQIIPIVKKNPQQPQVSGLDVVKRTVSAIEQSSAVVAFVNIGTSGNVKPQKSDAFWESNGFSKIDEQIDPTVGVGYFVEGEEQIAVDMGFGDILWSTKNVGASKISDSGGLYGWGDPFGHLTYASEDHYPAQDPDKVLPYNSISGTRMDIATAQWGDGWRIPSMAEWVSLKENCTFNTGTKDGQRGIIATSKITGKSIFLPAGGERFSAKFNNGNALGMYWSGDWCSTTKPSHAWCFRFSSYHSNSVSATDATSRTYGYSIRPVRSKSTPLNDYPPIVVN